MNLYMFFSEVNPRGGQVGIIILLIVVVMSTIGISVVSRSSTDVSLSRSTEDANRAFDAAESGAEQALSDTSALDPSNSNPVSGSITSIPNVSVDYTVNKLNILDAVVDEGFSASLSVTGAPNGGSLDISWSNQTTCTGETPASLVITVYSAAGVSPTYRKIYAGACTQTPSDNFTIAGPGTGNYFRRVVVPLVNTDSIVRIRPVYNQTALRVASVGWNLPVQQFQVTSTAQSTLNKETKALQVDRTLPQAPSLLDFTLFAGGTISN
jgi:hypothetical protein